ncbi:MAG: hypothetical protein ACTSW3_10440 [Promethearchaeota archaeon]
MCNLCFCENYEKCSIIGYLPYDYCCPECVYKNTEKCLKNQEKVQEIFETREERFHVLPKAFCLKTRYSDIYRIMELYKEQ